MSLLSGFADISVVQLTLIAGMALIASVVGGVSGYGTGALMPLVLVPIVGPEPVVPMLSISALLNNGSRAAVFRNLIDLRRVLVVLPLALPTTMLGAWGYTKLTGRGVMLLIGSMMILSVPLRRLLKRRGFGLSNRGLAASAAGWGLVAGRPPRGERGPLWSCRRRHQGGRIHALVIAEGDGMLPCRRVHPRCAHFDRYRLRQ